VRSAITATAELPVETCIVCVFVYLCDFDFMFCRPIIIVLLRDAYMMPRCEIIKIYENLYIYSAVAEEITKNREK